MKGILHMKISASLCLCGYFFAGKAQRRKVDLKGNTTYEDFRASASLRFIFFAVKAQGGKLI